MFLQPWMTAINVTEGSDIFPQEKIHDGDTKEGGLGNKSTLVKVRKSSSFV